MKVIRIYLSIAVICLAVAPALWADLPPDTEVVEGEWQGALYAIYVPAAWNGDLVLYAHGYRAPEDPIELPDYGPRDQLVTMGYAVAYSSYSVTGWAVDEGFFETRHLLPLFTSLFENPDDVYVVGTSMGGLITVRLAEKNPGLFAGALPMCGVVAGTRVQFDFTNHVRATFDYFFPGVIPGDQFDIPDDLILNTWEAYFWLYDNVLPVMCPNDWPWCDNPDPRVLELAGIDQVAIPWAEEWEAPYSVMLTLWGQITATPDLLDLYNGKIPFDNFDVFYTGSSDDPALNAGVARFEAHPSALNAMRRSYEPSGKLMIPMLTLHTTRDGLVLNTQEEWYAQRVAEQGYSDNLVQYTIDRYDHCTFTVQEEVQAFLDLVDWVETGVKPVP